MGAVGHLAAPTAVLLDAMLAARLGIGETAGWPCLPAHVPCARQVRGLQVSSFDCPPARASSVNQTTIKGSVRLSGIGLHSGAPIDLVLREAPADSGIVFCRIDLQPAACVRAHVSNVVDTQLATTLQNDAAKVSTVEHLLAALSGLQIDNLLIELDGPEVPAMDGSAEPFVLALQAVGSIDLQAPRRYLRVLRAVEVCHGDATARISPGNGFSVSYTLIYDHPVFRSHPKHAHIDVNPASFASDVSRARTFGFIEDFDRLRALKLALGAGFDNVVVVGETQVLNEGGLRQDDEFVKHKLLDAIGDLMLIGMPVIGHFEGYKSGHSLNNLLIRQLLAQPDAFEVVAGASLALHDTSAASAAG